jgi:hypothetical protein
MRQHVKFLSLFATIAMVSVAIGVAASTWIRSPAQVAADAKPVDATRLFSTVTSGRLQHVVTGSGAVRGGPTVAVEAGDPLSGADPIVTRLPVQVGSWVSTGRVVVEIADRPLIVLEGQIPLIRDLRPTMSGPDVARLQSALADAGHPAFDTSGYFGASTAAALENLYEAAGYDAPRVEVPSVQGPGSGDTDDGSGRELSPQSDAVTAPPSSVVVASRSELAFVARLPAVLGNVNGAIGRVIEAPAVELVSGTPEVRAEINPVDAGLLRVGQKVRLSVAGRRKPLMGSVFQVGEPRRGNSGQFTAPVRVRTSDTLDRDLVGSKAELSIVIDDREVDRGLIVPLTAIVTSSDGSTRVSVERQGVLVDVPVDVVDSAEGRVVVSGDGLQVGDRVLVGATD